MLLIHFDNRFYILLQKSFCFHAPADYIIMRSKFLYLNISERNFLPSNAVFCNLVDVTLHILDIFTCENLKTKINLKAKCNIQAVTGTSSRTWQSKFESPSLGC